MVYLSAKLGKALKTSYNFCVEAAKIAEWNTIATQRLKEQNAYLSEKLTENQKNRVHLLADAFLELDVYEASCLMTLINEEDYRASGIGVCDLNLSWPAYKQFGMMNVIKEANTWPGQDQNQLEQNLKQLFEGDLPDLKTIFGGLGSSNGSSPAKVEEVKEAVVEKIVEVYIRQSQKSNYDIELIGIDAAQKIKIIKEVRQIFNLGLKEAKDLVDKLPAVLAKGQPKDKADEFKEKLVALGCTINLI